MPSFWSYISNGEYSVGCTGRTVYVYDKMGNELAKFKHLPYSYTPAFSPKGDIFVVKTTEGGLVVCSLEKLCIIKKFRFSKVDYSQDDNFCFSPDGEKLYNIERHKDSCKTVLSIYNTSDFSLEKQLFDNDKNLVLSVVEYDKNENIFLMGFFRGENRVADKYFVGKLLNDELVEVAIITEKEYDFYQEYKDLEVKGFTKKAKEWSELSGELLYQSDIENSNFSLVELWERYYSEKS